MSGQKAPSKKLGRLVDLLCEEVMDKSASELRGDVRLGARDSKAHIGELRDFIVQKVNKLHNERQLTDTSQIQSMPRKRGGKGPIGDNLGGESSFVNWTNKSVIQFAQGIDPLRRMIARAEELVMKALELGWDGPPYDPFRLAELLHIKVAPRSDISEARIVDGPHGGYLIEFNPLMPPSRVRFSIAHEISHTFFSDCLERARYRARRSAYTQDDWQLELLCNVGAAEILMPTGSFSSLREEGFDIIRLMELRKTLGVSTEAILLRIVKLAKAPIACFVASHRTGKLRADYIVSSNSWNAKEIGFPEKSLAQQCSAIGFIAKGKETWSFANKKTAVDVQAVGLPSYSGQAPIRVAGLVRPTSDLDLPDVSVKYLVGDALQPVGDGKKIIAHIVNDTTPRWGGTGFAAFLKREWPEISDAFKEWAHIKKNEFRLGATHIAAHSGDISVVSMVAQRGYGPSDRPRIRYAALEACLSRLAEIALADNCSVHMPKIGTGYAAGNWGVIEELVERLVCAKGLQVFVYQLNKERIEGK